MEKTKSTFHILGVCAVFVGGLLLLGGTSSAQQSDFTEQFRIEECKFSSTGRNPYFILEPGYKLVLEGDEDGEAVILTITVLDETEVVDGVETRVVEERETKNGMLAEVSRNFFAICKRTNSVFYFGEDVDDYEDGQVVGHEGVWRAGVDDARPGLMMPGIVLLGSRYYQEIAPDVAMDRAEIISLNEVVSTPLGTFESCLKVEETNPIEADEKEYKLHAPLIGLVQDEDLLLSEAEELHPLEIGPIVQASEFTEYFMLDACEFSSTGTNPYFVLQPGHRLVLEGEEDGEPVVLVITVLNETEVVDGVETRVVEERESKNGVLAEVSRNFFAICKRTNSVFYFGEDVDDYEDGQVVSHEGAWRAGVDGARPGVMMPGTVLLGSRYYQELAPEAAMDRAENLSLTEVASTPAGTFENCLKVEETNPLEPDETEYKLYAPGIGVVQDEDLLLTEYEISSFVEFWQLMR